MLPAREFINDTRARQEEQVERNFQLINNQRQREKRAKINLFKTKMLVGVILSIVLLLAYTALTAQVTMYAYQINTTKVNIADAENANSRLLLEVENLSTPSRIEEYAKTQLGMVVPKEDQILYKGAVPYLSAQVSKNANKAVTPEVLSTIAASGTALSTEVPQAEAKIEVIEDEKMHPILDGLNDLVNKFLSAREDKKLSSKTQ